MRNNMIFDSNDKYHQQKIPISPQNYDPIQRHSYSSKGPSSVQAQKKMIFSDDAKPRATMESIQERRHAYNSGESQDDKDQFRAYLANELKQNLSSVKNELVHTFQGFLREYKSRGKINHEEIQEIKRQISQNKNQFEDIQLHIADVSQKFTDINSLCVKELEELKHNIGVGGDRSYSSQHTAVSNELIQKQMELQFKTLKQNLTNEITYSLKNKGGKSGKINENMVNQLKDIKHSFDEDLRQNFDVINGRIKGVEENLNGIMRKKREMMEDLRTEMVQSLKNNEQHLSEDISDIKRQMLNKIEDDQLKYQLRNFQNSKEEVEKRIQNFKREMQEQQQKNERQLYETHEKIERAENDSKDQVINLENCIRNSGTSSVQNSLIENRINKLQNDSEFYNRTLNALRNQLEEIQRVNRLFQNQSQSRTEELRQRVNTKISTLQRQITNIEGYLKKQQETEHALRSHQQQQQQMQEASSTQDSQNMMYSSNPPPMRPTHDQQRDYGYSVPVPLSNQQSGSKASSQQQQQQQQPPSLFNNQPSRTASNDSTPYGRNFGVVDYDLPGQKEEMKQSGFHHPVPVDQSQQYGGNSHGGQPVDLKYYGDPKVKSIIEEYLVKKRDQGPFSFNDRHYSTPVTMTSVDQPAPQNIQEKPNQSPNKQQQQYSKYNYQNFRSPFSDDKEMIKTPYDSSYKNLQGMRASATDFQNPMASQHDTPISNRKQEAFQDQQQQQQQQQQPLSPLQHPVEHEHSGRKIDENQSIAKVELSEVGPIPDENTSMSRDKAPYQLPPRPELKMNSTPQYSQGLQPFNDSRQPSSKRDPSFVSGSGYDTDNYQDCQDQLPTTEVQQTLQTEPRELPIEKAPSEKKDKKIVHKKILAQIDLFINGTQSELLNEDDSEIYCNLDEDGYIFDEDGEYVLDQNGEKRRLSNDEIEKFNNNNMIE